MAAHEEARKQTLGALKAINHGIIKLKINLSCLRPYLTLLDGAHQQVRQRSAMFQSII